MSGNSKEPSKTALMIREGANLPEDAWRDARVAAVMGQLPTEIRQLPKEQMFAAAIQFFGTAQRYDLDPMQGEIFGWWDRKKGSMVCMVGRDGLLKIASRDTDILGVQSDIVRAGDTFRKIQRGDKIDIEHISEPFGEGTGATIGAYALVKKREGPDVFVARRLDQFASLMGKRNWQSNPDEMLETRVISFALRKSTALLAGVYTEGDYAFAAPSGEPEATPIDRRKELPTRARSEALADELGAEAPEGYVDIGEETQTGIEIEAEQVEEIGEVAVSPEGDVAYVKPAETYVPMLETNGDMAPGYFIENLSRGWCRLWRVASVDEQDTWKAGTSAAETIYADTAGCHVLLVTSKNMRLVDLVAYARKDFEQYETATQEAAT